MHRPVPEIDSVAAVFRPPCAKSLISQALWHGENQAGLRREFTRWTCLGKLRAFSTPDSRSRSALPLTHRNTKRKMLAVGPWVAADSESILRTFRFVGASCAASAASRDLTLALAGERVSFMTAVPAAMADVFSDNDAPPGLRHRRFAPESA